MTDLYQLHAAAIDRACDVEAAEIVDCIRNDFAGLMDGDEMDLFEHLHEVIDSHSWIIYTAQAEAIGYGSRFRDAYEEEIGEAPPTAEARAFCALQRHVFESSEWDELYKELRGRGVI